ncbi:hypothetical protein L227DRAFT_582132 [Lentinus tigrinus ALCF2SS1-6]|uniref:F-box domain-containing protein n=1 Tax=Lentinus tigrinus ALCF2SS1-6 TaxID=1328759 RepID=A0A5C2RQ43_9APHY|nr:hypothetical protein L227DRAFT_582132 [Lentinus tigrinus ALCF2SS1-6]
MTATLQALSCDEIIEEILEKLAPGRLPRDVDEQYCLPEDRAQRRLAQRTLARAARVCRAFEGPALNVLWRVVDDILHLLGVLPGYSGVYPYTFTRDITEQEWHRFRRYLVRVRELDAIKYGFVEPFTWTVLRRWCPQGLLLPLLQRVRGFAFDYIGLSHTLLLAPTLDDISIELHKQPSDAMVKMVLQEMMPVLSQVRTLVVSGDAERIELIPTWTFVQLRSLEITCSFTPTLSSLKSLLAFPHLQELSLNLSEMDHLAGIPLNPGFEALQDLRLTGSGLSDVVVFLEMTKPPKLRSFQVQCNRFLEDTTLDSVLSELDTIHAALPSSLLHYHVRFSVVREDVVLITAGGPTAAQLLEPLRSRSDMRTISFHFMDIMIGLTDQDLVSVQELWPSLTAFEFAFGAPLISNIYYNYSYSDDSQSPTLASVVAFVSAHPQLERFAIPSMNLTSPLPALDSLPSTPNHRLRRLRVPFFIPGPSLIELGLLVDKLYPNLDLTDIKSTCNTGFQRGQHFDLLLFGLQAGRRGAHLLDGARLGDLGMF